MENRIRNNFNRQGFMTTLGASLVLIERGKVVIECSYNETLSQQNGFFHAGVLTSIADSACGYAAYTHMPEDSDVLSVEFKINLLKPARADKILAIASVLQAGKTLVVCEAIVTDSDQKKIYAKMTATMITIRNASPA